jgi:hypothetical protein
MLDAYAFLDLTAVPSSLVPYSQAAGRFNKADADGIFWRPKIGFRSSPFPFHPFQRSCFSPYLKQGTGGTDTSMISFNHLIEPLVGYPSSSALTASAPLLTELTGGGFWLDKKAFRHSPFISFCRDLESVYNVL